MSLTRKLLSGFGVMLALILLMSAAALVITRDLSGDLDRAANVTARSQFLAGEVDTKASDMIGMERAVVLSSVLGDGHAAQYQQSFDATAASLQRALADLHKTASTQEAVTLLKTLDQQALLVLQAHEELRRAMSNGQMDAALSIFAQKVAPSLEQIGRQASSLVEQQNRDLQATSEASAAKSSRSIRSLRCQIVAQHHRDDRPGYPGSWGGRGGFLAGASHQP
ncbi:Methyl-accepting chemotaxis sensory transducer (fragment) [Candidatus Sulfopaludibacter sp. SbA3]